tara:strand:+ start:58 stop:771 length:714 start_codon:yes stop_codon:yes gene_type:complete
MRTLARVLLSGGMDSTLCAVWASQTFRNVDAVAFDYGQRHAKELDAARQIAQRLGLPLTERKVRWLKGNLVGDGDDLTAQGAVVEGRNGAFLAAALAPSPAPSLLIFGACADDQAVFEDCRPEFFNRTNERVLSAHGATVLTPLIRWHKKDIAAVLVREAPELLALTWSCYSGGKYPCGWCGACIARSRGFIMAGLDDPQPANPALESQCPKCNAKPGGYCYHPNAGYVGIHKERRC